MLKSISVYRRHLVAITLGVFAALLFLTTPVPAVDTPPATTDLTPEQQLENAKMLSDEAIVKATLALETGDLALAQDAWNLINQASVLDCDVATHSADAENTKLAQSALNISIQATETLNLILAAAANIASTSTDTDTVAAANALQLEATSTQEALLPCQQTAMAAGASMAAAEEAYEPPADTPAAPPVFNPAVFGVEPPITDVSPASLV